MSERHGRTINGISTFHDTIKNILISVCIKNVNDLFINGAIQNSKIITCRKMTVRQSSNVPS